MNERTLDYDIRDMVDVEVLRQEVQDKYRAVEADPSGGYHFHTGRQHALRMGYPQSPLNELSDEATDAFAGVANPFYWGLPRPGERVVDLGSGAGMDSFIAALAVGHEGRVIGVDMTPEMIERSERLAQGLGLDNAEFKEGLIEDLPIESGWAPGPRAGGMSKLGEPVCADQPRPSYGLKSSGTVSLSASASVEGCHARSGSHGLLFELEGDGSSAPPRPRAADAVGAREA